MQLLDHVGKFCHTQRWVWVCKKTEHHVHRLGAGPCPAPFTKRTVEDLTLTIFNIKMGKLIYLITTSLDGFVADENGNFEWAMPSEEVHAYVNDIVCNVGTSLLGRNMYETMKVWDTIPTEGTSGPMDGPSEAMNDYAKIWRAAKKIVYSTSLSDVTIANATIERSFDPSTIQKSVAESDKDFDIGGRI